MHPFVVPGDAVKTAQLGESIWGMVAHPSRSHKASPMQSIEASSYKPRLNLSENETALWLDCIKRPNFPGHVLPVYFHFEPEPSPAALQKALDSLVLQFPRLAMTVVENNGMPRFMSCAAPKIKFHILTALPKQDFLMQLAFADMPLGDAPMMQWHSFQIGSATAPHTRHLLRCHHLLGDQQSVAGLWQALAQALNKESALVKDALVNGNQATTKVQPVLGLGYPITLERWQAAHASPALHPEFDPEPLPSGLALSVFESLSTAQSKAIQQRAKAAQLTTFELLLAAYANSLDNIYGAHARSLYVPAISQKNSGQYDVCTVPLLLEPMQATSSSTGMLRAQDLAAQLRAANHALFPPHMKIAPVGVRHGIVYSRAPLAACAGFSGLSSNLEGHRISLGQANSTPLSIVLHRLPAQPAPFASCAQIYYWDDRLHLSMQLDRALYSKRTASLILHCWQTEIERLIAAKPAQRGDRVFGSESQRCVSNLQAASISVLLAQASARFADCIALDDGYSKLSYRDLESFCSRQDALPDELETAPSITQAVQCYVALRTRRTLDFRVAKSPSPTQLAVQSEVDCAVIFASSGTTAKPATITLSSANLAAYATAMIPALALKPGDRVLRFAASAFDAVLEELLVCFLSGATLVCPVDLHSRQTLEARFESFLALSKRMEALGITALNVSTSWWHAAVQDKMAIPLGIRQIVIGGEAACAKLWRQFNKQYPAIDLVNTYGLTEVCVSQCIFRGKVDSRRKFVPIGEPMSHVDAVIFQVNTDSRAGALEPGELCLRGASLGETSRADRYFEHFGKRYLRTGDRVVLDASDVMHYLGRLNRTVKHLGKGLDLDALGLGASEVQAKTAGANCQIHALLVATDGNQSQLVLLHEDAPTKELCAFAALHHALLFRLKSIPRTSGGKPDYQQMQDAFSQTQTSCQVSICENAKMTAARGGLDALIRAAVSTHFDDSTQLSTVLNSLDWLRLRGAIELQFGVQLKHADHDLSVAKLRQLLDIANAPLLETDEKSFRHKFGTNVLPRQSDYLHSGFSRAQAQFPDAIALISAGQSLSYRELFAQSLALQKRIQQAGVAPGARVAFSATRTIFDVLAMLAISAAGAVFVPLSMTLKKSEAAEQIAQVGANFWLHEGKVAPVLEPIAQTIKEEIPDLAYILLTSGSSGRPKAVAMTHAAANNTLNDLIRRVALGSRDTLLALSPTQFDLSIFDVFAVLSVGATLVWPDEPQRCDVSAWPELVLQHVITIWNSVPSSLNLLLADADAADIRLKSLRFVLLSGDFVAQSLIRRALQALPEAEVAVLGGATEAGIWSCIFDARQLGERMYAPYGEALAGQQLIVEAAQGEVGEIIIMGASVAAGYLQNGDLALRFVDENGAQRYHTGDLGRTLADGCIEIHGRQDQQVKWRGLRVSVADTEALLLSEAGIYQAVAINLDSILVAVIVLEKLGKNDHDNHPDAIISRLKRRFAQSDAVAPDTYEIFHRPLPLTVNGKLDRIALRQQLLTAKSAGTKAIHAAHSLTQGYSAHPSALSLWQQFLPSGYKPEAGDWFSQGGHSLQALKLIEAARSLGAGKATLGSFLRQPTLRHLSSWFEGRPQQLIVMDLAATNTTEITQLQRTQDAILITGATGMLALGLIKQLLERTTRPLILCVRGKTQALAEQRMMAAISEAELNLGVGRVQTLLFDLAEPELGWSAPLFDAVAGAITEIWHLGAEVNFLLSDAELAACNTGSVEAIFKLAERNGALLHFASSLGVFPYQLDQDVDEYSDRPTGLFASGYARSKWHAEQRLRVLTDQSKAQPNPVRLRIYRLGLCVSNIKRAQDIVAISRIALSLCKSWPDSMMPVNALAQADAVSALLLLADFDENSAQTRIWHVQHDQPESINALRAQIAPSAAKISLRDWLTTLALSKPSSLDTDAALARDLLLLLIPAGLHEPIDAHGQVLNTHTISVLKSRGWRPQSVATALRTALVE